MIVKNDESFVVTIVLSTSVCGGSLSVDLMGQHISTDASLTV